MNNSVSNIERTQDNLIIFLLVLVVIGAYVYTHTEG